MPQTHELHLFTTAIFATRDVLATVRYYEDVLGFERAWLWTEEDPTFACVRRGGVELFLSLQPEQAIHTEGLQQFFSVDDLDALHAEHAHRGAEIVSSIGDKPWGVREYIVRDLNGYRLRFSGPIVARGSSDSVEEAPPHIQIEVRVPSRAEFLTIERQANPGSDPSDRVLETLLTGVVAVDARSGEAVGMALATGDGINVIYVQNVAVWPSFQRQGIGSALMRRLMAALRERYAEGTFVFLLTGRTAFYTPFGFRPNGGAMTTQL